MLAIILDLGNTLQKAGIFDNGTLVRLEKYRKVSVSGLKALLSDFPDVRHGIAGSVVRFPGAARKFLEDRLERFIELNDTTPIPLINRYASPKTLGMDRIASAVTASRMFPGVSCLVINAGSCITYDLVTSGNEYLGGAISPGLQMRLNAMHTFTRKLPLLKLHDTGDILGDNTRNAMLSGAVHGTTAELTGIISEYKKRFPGLKVILSGGDMEYLDKHLKIRIFTLPNSVMIGLNYILEYNLQYVE